MRITFWLSTMTLLLTACGDFSELRGVANTKVIQVEVEDSEPAADLAKDHSPEVVLADAIDLDTIPMELLPMRPVPPSVDPVREPGRLPSESKPPEVAEVPSRPERPLPLPEPIRPEPPVRPEPPIRPPVAMDPDVRACVALFQGKARQLVIAGKGNTIRLQPDQALVLKVAGSKNQVGLHVAAGEGRIPGLCLIVVGDQNRLVVNLDRPVGDIHYRGMGNQSQGVITFGANGSVLRHFSAWLGGHRAQLKVQGREDFPCPNQIRQIPQSALVCEKP